LSPKRALVLTLALAAAVFVGLALYADFGLLDQLGEFRWELFPLALALTALNYLLRFVRWHLYLERLGIDVPIGRSFAVFVAGLTMTVTPAKTGEVLKCGLLRRSFDVPVRRSAPVVLAERVTDATGVVVLAVLAGASTDRWPLLVIALLGVAAIVLIVRSPLLERFAVLGEAPVAARLLLGPGLLAGMTALSAVSWFFECLAAYVCVRGLSLAEASMTGLIRALGDVSKASAAAATVLIRLTTLWFAVAIGLVGLAVEERLARKASVSPETARRYSNTVN